LLKVSNKKLLIIQPILTSYRKKLFDDLSDNFHKVDIYSIQNSGNGFKSNIQGKFNSIHTPLIGNRNKIYYQKGIIFSIIKNRPTAIFLTADFRAVHYFLILLIAKILHIPIFSHGQGLYDKPTPSLIHRVLFKTTIWLSSSYVCYTKSVYQTLVDIGIKPNKLSIMDNTILNEFPVRSEEKTNTKNKLLYIGRLREGCNLELLFDAMRILEEDTIKFTLDIVGDGEKRVELEKYTKKLNLDINFLGAIYDDELISELSKESKVGIYPGDAGLSIVHYMSLSLVPIVHSDLTKHMGPEPSYIKDNENGLMFICDDKNSLADVIRKALKEKELSKTLSKSAFNTYESLLSPTMAEKLMNTMTPHINKGIL
jgi:glycosyltransferase involved in cell wall biosynthesis